MSKWMVNGLIPRGHIVLVVGQPGNGKSWWVAQLAVDAAEGGKHLGEFDMEQHSVIYIDEDTPTDTYEERIARIAVFAGKPVQDLDITQRSMSGFRLFDNKSRQALAGDIKRLKNSGKHVLLIIDCLGKVMAGQNLDTVGRATKVMGYLTELRDAGATVIVVHHITLKKKVSLDIWDTMGLVLNSTVLVSSSDTAFTVLQVPVLKPTMFIIKPQARRVSLKHQKPFAVQLFEDEDKSFAQLLKIDEIPNVPSDNAKLLFKLFPDSATELTVKQIDEKLQRDLSEPAIRDGLKELVLEQCLEKMVNPHDKSHAAWYTRHHGFHRLESYYKERLLDNNI